ncbi:hypothetical protein BJ508DRAFT_133078 [Ascobolus immersus RN42]|uniref:Uncharacterized protein n=1 Tax=Ascobolus immersus RN42 TaxID=1160509 RepID=A0A3N4I3N4_ASCIM|nr:hypothetical protein BJ508DRAFT_133078 [Ascobolus immersus RN42]
MTHDLLNCQDNSIWRSRENVFPRDKIGTVDRIDDEAWGNSSINAIWMVAKIAFVVLEQWSAEQIRATYLNDDSLDGVYKWNEAEIERFVEGCKKAGLLVE